MTDKSQRAGKIFRSLKEIDRHIGRLAERLWPINTQSNNPEPQSTAEQLAEIEGQAQYILPAGWQEVPLGEPLKGGDEYHAGLNRYIRQIEPEPQPDIRPIESDKTQELPTETQELEGKTQELPEYTPPEGWRVLAVGEELREGDVIVHKHDAMYATARAGKFVQANQRYIRPIEPRPQPEPCAPCDSRDTTTTEQPADTSGRDIVRGLVLQVADLIQREEPQPELQQADTPATEYTPPEGWRVLQAGERLRFGDIAVNKDGSCRSTERVGGWVGSYQRYIRPIEPQPQPPQRDPEEQPQEHEQPPMLQDAEQKVRLLRECYTRQAELIADLKYERAGALERGEVLSREKRKLTEQIEELRSEVSHVQRLLGESRQRVTHLEELVGSLRTINEAQEKSFNAANKANDDLQHRLNVVSKEWAEQAATSNGLRAQLDKKDAQIRDLKIELDSLQQVPADSTPMTNNDVISRSDAVDAVVLAAVEHVVAIVARLHNTQVTPELHNTIVQAIGQLTAQSPEQHDAVIPPVVAEHCDAMPALVQSVFYNIPDAG